MRLWRIRSIRLDVFSVDEEHVVYNTEMQQKRKNDLAKRSRYYQALVDISLLEPGIPNYNLLNQSYIIMIMPFDLFGYGKYRYTFYPVCKEVPECGLEDGAVRIFLNTRGKNPEEVSSELVEFLEYLEHTTDKMAGKSNSEYIRRIHKRVCKVKANEEVGIKYMQAWEERYYDREEAREEGFQIGLKEGREEGRKKGWEEGTEKGREKGREEGRERTKRIFKLHIQGKSEEEIAKICEVSIEEVHRTLE